MSETLEKEVGKCEFGADENGIVICSSKIYCSYQKEEGVKHYNSRIICTYRNPQDDVWK